MVSPFDYAEPLFWLPNILNGFSNETVLNGTTAFLFRSAAEHQRLARQKRFQLSFRNLCLPTVPTMLEEKTDKTGLGSGGFK